MEDTKKYPYYSVERTPAYRWKLWLHENSATTRPTSKGVFSKKEILQQITLLRNLGLRVVAPELEAAYPEIRKKIRELAKRRQVQYPSDTAKTSLERCIQAAKEGKVLDWTITRLTLIPGNGNGRFAFGINWETAEAGFGSLEFLVIEDSKGRHVRCNNECMSRKFIKSVLDKMVDDMELSDPEPETQKRAK